MAAVIGPRRAQSNQLDNKTHSSDRPHPEDAAVLLPTGLPSPVDYKSDAVWRVGKYVFRANFDSANLESVEQGFAANEFLLQTRRDCGGTENEKSTRTWFYFSILGHNTGDVVILTILNLNKQSRLYSQDYRPVFWCASQPEWQPLKLRVTYRREGDDFQLRFCHRFESEEETLFAFAIPFSYRQTQEMLSHLDEQLPFQQHGVISCGTHAHEGVMESSSASLDAGAHSSASPLQPLLVTSSRVATTADRQPAGCQAQPLPQCVADACNNSGCGGGTSPCSRIYYRRQLLKRSLEGRRVELITITDCYGATGEAESPLSGVFEHDPGPPSATFREKTVFFVSSRVHPGETPATHIFNGMLAFLLRRSDPRAAALRRRFVFKLVPIVNPDGVAVGNYRTDTLGQNLNRFYTGVPDESTQPSVYAIKTLLMHYAQQGILEYYIDLHAHANKKGVFIYGNTLGDCDAHMQSLLYAKLVALNNPAFDFVGCNYTEKNMVRADKDGASKEGAGRVALYRETGLTHLYTIEANYNMARTLNVVAPASGDHGGRASPPCNKRFPPKFTVGTFHGVGRAILIAALDLEGANPWSRLPHSEHRSLDGVRSWILTVLRATPETRAAHLPAMSDVAVEKLRGMIVSGTLRVSPAFGSNGRSRPRPSALPSGESAAANTIAGGAGCSPSSFAFGRSVGANTRSRVTHTPLPARRSNASLPTIAVHGPNVATTSPISTCSISSGRGAIAGSHGRTSNDGLARSTSLPVKSTTSLVLASSPLQSVGSASGIRDAVADLGADESEDADVPITPAAAITGDAGCAITEGPSDSDGDDEHDDRTRTASPASSSSATGGPSRLRAVESPLRSPTTSFKAAAVYCGRVTEFKFPLNDRMDSSLASGVLADVPTHISAGILGHVNAAARHRPPSAGISGRLSSSGAAFTNNVPASAPVTLLAANGAVSPRHISVPQSTINGAAILTTPDQLVPASSAKNTTKSKSTLGFVRSSSANRRNR
ncbi:hypothetical protein VaNZ11_006745 [Volvox africanus]|uniref:Cytosolic carboxypeptidase-like protein 5 n=1 Tax=Volvox africanus TaxID=51714 RepID=A0ABQ5S342_9CHLO|nr:hypothetical protein VaNZ11_006745 [Volvox africanus]